MSSSLDQALIDRNVRIHDRVAARYEATHDEIFNDREQSRLRDALGRAAAAVRTGSAPLRALDLGCGSGNLTRHLLDLGFEVVAADVSEKFLRLVEKRYAGRPVATRRIEGDGLPGFADAEFDLVAAYSVLHHIPDYLGAVAEMGRVTRPGGVVYIDHEHCPGHWDPNPAYGEFLKRARRPDWRKFLVPRNYYGKIRRLLVDPHYSNEGDIHVWPDDHVEWDEVERVLGWEGFRILFADDYLVFRGGYRPEVYDAWRGRCADMRVTAARRDG